MKLTTSLTILLMYIGLCSCAGTSSTDGKDTTIADTPAIATTEEASQPELLSTPDLTLLETKGNVKEIKGKPSGDYVYGGSAKFNEEGQLTHYGNSEPIDKLTHVKRDGEGRLTDFLASEWMTVKWDGEKPRSMAGQYNELTTTDTYTYDETGLVVKIAHRYQDDIEGDDETVTATVTYPQDGFDSNGNWVKRIVKYPDHTETQVREIIYY